MTKEFYIDNTSHKCYLVSRSFFMNKVNVSPMWKRKERSDLLKCISAEILRLDQQEARLRETILYNAPCFAEIEKMRADLKHRMVFLTHASSGFLEANRQNYGEFIH